MSLRHAAGALLVLVGFSGAAAAQGASTAPAAKPAAAAKPSAAKPVKPAPAKPGAPEAAAAPEERPMGEAVVAIVNDQVISTYDLNQRMSLIALSAGIRPTPEVMEQIQAQALRSLEDERLQMGELKERKVNIDAKEVDAALENIARNGRTSVPALKAQLASAGIGIETLRAQVQAQIGWNRLISGLYGRQVRISDSQVQDTLARLAANSAKPQVLVSMIFLPAETPAEIGDAQTAGMRLIEELKKGANFSAVAQQFSAAPSAAAGGDMDWLALDELKPVELQRATESMSAGDVAGPITAPGGIYIIALRDKRAGVDPKASSRVTIKQISAANTQMAAMERARKLIRGCNSVATAISGVTGLESTDLGQIQETELSDEMRKQIADTPTGQASAPFKSDDKLRMLVVCARDTAGGALPSREEISDRLVDQELAMLSQRYLRNLRREAAIVRR
ncbi:MAG: peptidylprolyl isomerase [Alphaproteobacteria bacterium]